MSRIRKSFIYIFFTLCMLCFIFGNNLNVKAYDQFYSAAGITVAEENIKKVIDLHDKQYDLVNELVLYECNFL